MSGGHYSLRGYQVSELGADILQDVQKYSKSGESGDYYSKQKWEAMAPEVLAIMRKAGIGLEHLGKLVHSIDYLMSGDYGEETFKSAYQQWLSEGSVVIGQPATVSPQELADLRNHSAMLGQIAGHVMSYLPEESEATTLEGVLAMQKEIDRLKAELAAAKTKAAQAPVASKTTAGKTAAKKAAVKKS